MSFKTYMHQFKSNDKYNYVSFDGGKYYIDSNNKQNFFQKYMNAFNTGEYLYMVELCTYPCKFFIDIDKEIDLNFILNFFDSEISIICKCTETKGIHLIFPNLIMKSFDDIACVPIELRNVIDMSVYKSGLRMIGSKKLHQNRIYLPVYKYKGCKKIETFRTLNMDLLHLCSIHTHDSSIYEKAKKRTNSINVNIFENLHPEYNNIKIKKVFRYNNDIICIQTNSKFCLNLNDYHKNNFIYFLIKKNKKDNMVLCQKCFCKCNTKDKRLYDYCKNFTSIEYILTLDEINYFKKMC